MEPRKVAKFLDLFGFFLMNRIQYSFLESLSRVYDKALPIPTQTDPINKMEHKSTSSQEVKDNSVGLLFI